MSNETIQYFKEKYQDGLFEWKELDIWLDKKLEFNNNEHTSLSKFVSGIGYIMFGALLTMLISNLQKLNDVGYMLLSTIPFVIVIVLIYFLRQNLIINQKALQDERKWIFDLYYQIKLEIKNLENQSKKRKKRGD
ncbi:MAG: hypothetical protein PHH08_03275 [Candidatus ainarchaeum sp.]|nr:hypothetical protein [Candidatus ainarchaeum sp.]